MDFVFQIYVALVVGLERASKISRVGILPWPTATWLALSLEICEVFHVDVEEALACLVDGFYYVGAGAGGVAYVYAAADARVEIFSAWRTSSGEGQSLSSGP